MGIKDANNMGAAMAPAAFNTLVTHFQDTGRKPSYYDAIITGDFKQGRHIICTAIDVWSFLIVSVCSDNILSFEPVVMVLFGSFKSLKSEIRRENCPSSACDILIKIFPFIIYLFIFINAPTPVLKSLM